jgi:hypothetical protein
MTTLKKRKVFRRHDLGELNEMRISDIAEALSALVEKGIDGVMEVEGDYEEGYCFEVIYSGTETDFECKLRHKRRVAATLTHLAYHKHLAENKTLT